MRAVSKYNKTLIQTHVGTQQCKGRVTDTKRKMNRLPTATMRAKRRAHFILIWSHNESVVYRLLFNRSEEQACRAEIHKLGAFAIGKHINLYVCNCYLETAGFCSKQIAWYLFVAFCQYRRCYDTEAK